QTGLNGNISADPLFVSPSTADYHLRRGSPAIDAGKNMAANLPATDFDGDPRILDGNGDGIPIVDMGIDEVAPDSFDICLQDDSNGSLLKINSTTGEYLFSRCNGFVLGGRGSLTLRGSLITLQDNAVDRRISARIDKSLGTGTASIQLFSQGTTFTIS